MNRTLPSAVVGFGVATGTASLFGPRGDCACRGSTSGKGGERRKDSSPDLGDRDSRREANADGTLVGEVEVFGG